MKNTRQLLIKNLKLLRKHNGLTQSKLAEKIEVSLRTVQKYESGEAFPSPETLTRIARQFHVTESNLLEDGSPAVTKNLNQFSIEELEVIHKLAKERIAEKRLATESEIYREKRKGSESVIYWVPTEEDERLNPRKSFDWNLNSVEQEKLKYPEIWDLETQALKELILKETAELISKISKLKLIRLLILIRELSGISFGLNKRQGLSSE